MLAVVEVVEGVLVCQGFLSFLSLVLAIGEMRQVVLGSPRVVLSVV
jgi:hypothetical protein